MAINIARITAAVCVKANPSAVPRNGAVHGVARTVAKTPWKNEPNPCLGRRKQTALNRLWQRDFKNAEEIQREYEHKQLKPRTKYGLVN